MDSVLITGGAGFIGCHTAQLMLERGYRVRALDSLKPPVHQPHKPPPWLPKEVELLVGDVRDKDMVTSALRNIDAVIHLAAYQDYLPDFSSFFDINTVGTALLYEVIVEKRLPVQKIVIASSQAVCGEGRHYCEEHGAIYPGARSDQQLRRGNWEIRCAACGQPSRWQISDESTVNPQNQYAISKHTQELVAFNLGRRYGIPTTCLRYSITQGQWQSPRNAYSGICRVFTLRALSGKPPLVFEDGLQCRDYVYVADVARANLLALQDRRTDYDVYNVGGGQTLTTLEYANIVRCVASLVDDVEVPGYYRFGDTRHIVSNIDKLRRLGWQPTLGVEQIVSEYANWVESTSYIDQVTDEGIAKMLSLGSLRQAST